MDARVEPRDDRAKLLRTSIQQPVQLLDGECVGQLLGFLEVVDADESVFDLFVTNAFLIELPGKPVVPVEIELQAEGSPGRNAKITEAELRVDEIDVIVQAAAGVVLEEVGVRPLVVPGLEGGAGFHGREDVDDAGVLAALGKDFLDAIVFAEVLLADEFNLHVVFLGQGLDVFVDFISHRRGPLLEVEDFDAVAEEKVGDGAWMANVGQRSLDDHPIETGNDAHDVVRVTFEKMSHHENLQQENGGSQLCQMYSPATASPCMVPARPG